MRLDGERHDQDREGSTFALRFIPLNEISEKEGELNDEEAFITNMAEG